MSKITDISGTLRYIADCLCELDRITKLPNCNDCGKSMECEYRPRWGDMVRFNCPMWEAKPEKAKEAT